MAAPDSPPTAAEIAARLAALGLALPRPQTPIGSYIPFRRSGALLFVSGQGAKRDGGALAHTGRLGENLTVEQGQEAARFCAVNLLAHVHTATGGDLGRVRQVVRLGGFVVATPEFTAHATVMNGASDLMAALFGAAGQHARTTVGVPSLPGGTPVEVEGLFELA